MSDANDTPRFESGPEPTANCHTRVAYFLLEAMQLLHEAGNALMVGLDQLPPGESAEYSGDVSELQADLSRLQSQLGIHLCSARLEAKAAAGGDVIR